MFIDRDQGGGARFSRLLWRVAWLAQAALWLLLLGVAGARWLYEEPAVRAYYAAGLAQGFDSLAGITAALDPSWEEARAVRGRVGLGRLNRLSGDTLFSVWLDLDEMPGWNSGQASLRFDRPGRLLWVRRYFTASPPDLAVRYPGEAEFPVLRPLPAFREGRGVEE